MTFAAFVAAVLGLLLTPGPTNTLMAVAGAERGFGHALRLIPAELAGYLATTLPLAVAGTLWLHRFPAAKPAIAAVAAVWVMTLALRMWQIPATDTAGAMPRIGVRQVIITTMLNPKALIFGLVLLPPAEGLAFRAGIFSTLIVGVACAWIAFGAMLRRPGGAGIPPVLRRLAAVWLAILSVVLAAKAAAG